MPKELLAIEMLLSNDYYFKLLQPTRTDLDKGLFLNLFGF